VTPSTDYLWKSSHDAEDALLLYAANPAVEKVLIRKISLGELADGLRALAPAIVTLLDTSESIVVVEPGKVLSQDGGISRASWKQICGLWEEPARVRERQIFARLPIDPRAADKVIEQRIASQFVARVTHFAAPPGNAFAKQLAMLGWFRRLGGAITVHALAYIVGIAAWALIARAALSGRWDRGWFWGWVILLAIGLPLESFTAWWQGWLSLAFGGLLKQRLLAGSLEIDSDKIRQQGIGQLLSRVLESDSLESLSLTGGAAAILSIVELAGAAVILALGAMPLVIAGLFAVWLVLIGITGSRYARRRRDWMTQRNRLTHDLIEKMNGHRTRIAQQAPELWHQEEDINLVAYLKSSEAQDRLHALLTAVAPRGWLVLGMAAIGVAFITNAASTEALGISTAGVLLGYQTLRRLVFGLGQLAGAVFAWEMVRDLFDAAAAGETSHARTSVAVSPSTKVMEARGVMYSYPGRENHALQACSLTIMEGERILLQGSSGSGKSTFGAWLSGLRRQTGGLLLAGGVDRPTIGAQGWRRRVATAPQYHENHILAAPLDFNLLMGRSWPPSPDDMKEAYDVCHELGLGGLLERMPAGLSEMVGDTGWQLSQGEKSRVFLARALLQGAPLMILDESFAALDPETLQQCLQCVLRRASSLMVIAHP
jgi:ATP-binding cassette, subfamily B, bacterial